MPATALAGIFFNNGFAGKQSDSMFSTEKITDNNISYQLVNAIYPNPTTGKFTITFSKKLDGAIVQIVSATGAVILQTQFNGYRADFNISRQVAGIYFVVIRDRKNTNTFKIIKL